MGGREEGENGGLRGQNSKMCGGSENQKCLKVRETEPDT